MRKFDKSPGQAILEFVVILPIVLLLIMGTFELARAFSTRIVLLNAAREGAYYLTNHSSDGVNCGSSCYGQTILTVQTEAANSGINVAPGDVTITGCCTVGNPVQVRVNHSVNLSIYSFFFGPFQISGTEWMVVLK